LFSFHWIAGFNENSVQVLESNLASFFKNLADIPILYKKGSPFLPLVNVLESNTLNGTDITNLF